MHECICLVFFREPIFKDMPFLLFVPPFCPAYFGLRRNGFNFDAIVGEQLYLVSVLWQSQAKDEDIRFVNHRFL